MSFTQKFAASKYKELVPFWDRADDCYEGAIKIREKEQEYLPPLESERDAGGQLSFQWKTRFNLACFKNLLRPTVDDIVGIMQRKEQGCLAALWSMRPRTLPGFPSLRLTLFEPL